LVVGDSHFDGVVYNVETFAAVTENLLNKHSSLKRIQVLNASAGYYGPRHYEASLEAYHDLDPRIFVVGFYSGNDFLDAAKDVEEQPLYRVKRPSHYHNRLRDADRIHAGAVAQLLNQTYYFKTFPSMQQPVLHHIADTFRRMHRHCAARGKALQVILIPTKWAIEPNRMPPRFYEAANTLGLTPQDFAITPSMRMALKQELDAMDIPCWDPTAEMAQSGKSLFWDRDFHLNVAGHRLLAELFAPHLLAILEGKAS
jgi:hypothetical protein